MRINISDGCLKLRQGKYVIYDIDYLLSHLASEVALLYNAKQRDVTIFDREQLAKDIWKNGLGEKRGFYDE